MLRRPATTITLTSADLDAYEANRQRKIWEKQQQQQQQQAHAAHASDGAEMRTEPGQQGSVRPQQRSQKDRIMGGQTRQEFRVLAEDFDWQSTEEEDVTMSD